jgi:hypothetical protein
MYDPCGTLFCHLHTSISLEGDRLISLDGSEREVRVSLIPEASMHFWDTSRHTAQLRGHMTCLSSLFMAFYVRLSQAT